MFVELFRQFTGTAVSFDAICYSKRLPNGSIYCTRVSIDAKSVYYLIIDMEAGIMPRVDVIAFY